jgi:hypothetical protein
MPDPNDPSSYDPKDDEDPFASGPTPAQPGDDKVNPFDSDDPFASGPTPAQPGDENENPFEPMEDGLEDDDPPEDDPPEDDPPEDEKPPMQPRSVRRQVKLPGAKGPLEVDSIGDYLEDVDWAEIDSQARSAAAEGYPPSPGPREEQEDDKEAEEDKPVKPPEMATGDDVSKAADALGIGGIGKFSPKATGDDVKKAADDLGTGDIRKFDSSPFMPHGGPGTAEHVANQPSVDLAGDYGGSGPSSFNLTGQASTAKDEAVEKATDAINTATGRIVDMLQGLAQAMNAHSQRIAQIEDTLDMESESDVG